MSGPGRGTLRERKQERARQAIVDAALALFAERGFDRVTVTDIAERAEVGRSTFFRYFGDKQEVAFAGDIAAEAVIARAAQVPAEASIGDSLGRALSYVRAVVVSFAEAMADNAEVYALHRRLVAEHPELRARSLLKQRSYAEALVELLIGHGAERQTAVLAAEIGLACYWTGCDGAGDDPHRLPAAVDSAFARIS